MNWEQILTPAVLFILTVIIFPLVRDWIEKIRSERLREIGVSAMNWAEAEANKQLKDKDTTMLGEEKKGLAVNYALDLASAANIKVDRETIGKVIEEAIGAIKKK